MRVDNQPAARDSVAPAVPDRAGGARRFVEQQLCEFAIRQPQQQLARQPEQQPGFPCRPIRPTLWPEWRTVLSAPVCF